VQRFVRFALSALLMFGVLVSLVLSAQAELVGPH
jgi:hypothetical protein